MPKNKLEKKRIGFRKRLKVYFNFQEYKNSETRRKVLKVKSMKVFIEVIVIFYRNKIDKLYQTVSRA